MRAATDRLSARSFTLPGDPDLLDYYDPSKGFHFEHAGEGVVGVGAAVRIEVEPGADQVARAARLGADALTAIEHDGSPPLLVAAFPFDGASMAATLIVPSIVIARRNGRTSMIVTGREGSPEPQTMPHDVPPEPWDTLRVRSESDPATYIAAVAEARARIRSGALQKVVLARTVIAESDHAFDVPTLLERLRTVERDAYVFGVHGFLGASPELLVARSGDEVTARPLAGTAARASEPATDEAAGRALLASEKDRAEHAFVADAVRDTLAPHCVSLRLGEPTLLATSKVWHLATDVRGTLRAPALDSLTLAGLLHPTPAVCGTPRGAARDTIRELEPSARGLYAGLVGWMDARGDGEWAVALRCAEVEGDRARLHAGAGIVADSDPADELEETEAKFRALLDALRYG